MSLSVNLDYVLGYAFRQQCCLIAFMCVGQYAVLLFMCAIVLSCPPFLGEAELVCLSPVACLLYTVFSHFGSARCGLCLELA